MTAVSGKHLCRVLEKCGWTLQRINGSHHIYGQLGNPVILAIPVHENQDLKRGLLRQLMKVAGLTEDDL